MEQAGGEHRAGVPGGDDGVGVAGRDRADRADERGVGLGANRLGGLLGHADHLCGDGEREAAACRGPRGREA